MTHQHQPTGSGKMPYRTRKRCKASQPLDSIPATEDAENTEDAEPEEFQNHVGDGPSGFDYYHDTKWCC